MLSIPGTMYSFTQGLLNEDTRKEWTNLQRTMQWGERKTKVTNMEIWRGCCNQSLESSAFRGAPPPPIKLLVKCVQ